MQQGDFPPEQELARRIGAAIRARRKELGVTMAWLAAESSLSQPFLSRVERGLAQPSIRSLDNVARALGLSTLGLIGGMSEPGTFTVLPQRDRLPVPVGGDRSSVAYALTSTISQLRAVEIVGEPADPEKVHVHRNDAFTLVLAGRYEFLLDGQRFDLAVGDSISAPGGVGHRYRVLEQPARLLVVIVSEDAHIVHDPAPVHRKGAGLQRQPGTED